MGDLPEEDGSPSEQEIEDAEIERFIEDYTCPECGGNKMLHEDICEKCLDEWQLELDL